MKGILDPSVDTFQVLLCKVELPAFYAVAALYLSLYFLAKKFTLERGKYLLSTCGNPREYEKKLRENVVLKAAASLVTIIPIEISRDRGFRVFNLICLSFFIGQVGRHLVGRLTYHLMQYFLAYFFVRFLFNCNMISYF